MVEIGKQDPNRPDVVQLLEAADALMAKLYPAQSNDMLDVARLVQPDVSFFAALEKRLG